MGLQRVGHDLACTYTHTHTYSLTHIQASTVILFLDVESLGARDITALCFLNRC